MCKIACRRVVTLPSMNLRIIRHLILFFIALTAVSVHGASASSPQSNSHEMDDLGHRIIEKFTEADQKGIVIMDLQPAFGDAGSFGSWLADEVSDSLARQGQTVKVVDRGRLVAALDSEHLGPSDEWQVPKAVQLGRAVGAATVIVGSYGAVEKGIGVSLAAFRVSEYGMPPTAKFTICDVFGRIGLTREIIAHLSTPLDSLRPRDGVYRSGYGGVSVPTCLKCPVPSMQVPDIDLQGILRAHPQGGAVWLRLVVTADGHTRNINVAQPIGYGLDEQYVKAAADWEFKPAIDPDGKPVPATYLYHISFNFNGQAPPKPMATAASAESTSSPTSESPISNLVRAADQAVRNRDYSTCAELLEKVVLINPNYKNAWNYLGWTYNALGRYDKAEGALRKAIAVDPRDPRAYNNLGQALSFQKKYDDAIPQYQKQIEINPNDQWAHANLGRVYILTKQYEKAIAEFQVAATISPSEASIPFYLGRAYAKTNNPELAMKALQKSAELQPVPFRWNSVAYEMAIDKLDLAQAEKYAQSAIAVAVMEMRDISAEHLTRDDATKTSRIASYWDTWGWIQFMKGNLVEAEKYVKCAWLIHPLSIDSDHLGQIYERQKRKADAMRMYQMALAADSAADDTRQRLYALAGPQADIAAITDQGRALLKDASTITVKNSHQAEGFAEFWILLSPGPTIHGVKFISGDDDLAVFAKDLESVSYPNIFPEATELKILRRGRLSCTRATLDCRLQMISAPNVGTEELATATPSVAGEVSRFRVQSAKLVNKVQPIYPIEARQAGVEGIVRLHAIIRKDGSVANLEVISGDPLLQQAALEAVRQWVYEPTVLEGKPVEVDTTIDVTFRLNHSK